MYIELFLIDNFLMDYLIVRLAAGLTASPARVGRQLLAAALASVASAAVLQFMPNAPLARLAIGLILIPALPHSTVRRAAMSALSVFVSAFIIGGAATAAALASGGGVFEGALLLGLPVRAALCSVAAATFLPPAVRRLVARRARGHVAVRFTHDGKQFSFDGVIDSCNCLEDPFSGLPVIVVHCDALEKSVTRCLDIRTVSGDGMLCGFIPSALQINSGVEWRDVAACVALTPARLSVGSALVPAVLVTEDKLC